MVKTLGFGRVWLGGKSLELCYIDQVDHCVGVSATLALEGSDLLVRLEITGFVYGSSHKKTKIPICH